MRGARSSSLLSAGRSATRGSVMRTVTSDTTAVTSTVETMMNQ